MPRQLIAVSPRRAALVEYVDPPLHEDEVRVRVRWASPKHGTELTDFRAQSPFIAEEFDPVQRLFAPRAPGAPSGVRFGEWNLGNQWVGEIVAVGGRVTGFGIADLVSSYGGIRETQTVPAIGNPRLRRLPEARLWKNAVCHDPAQFAFAGVRDAGVRPGDRVAVIGLGAIGQLAAQLCRRAGALLVVAVDPIAARREVALADGADEALDPTSTDVGFELKRLTGSTGVDAVIETSGSGPALQAALRGLAYGGTVAYVAFAKEFTGLSFGREAHFNYGRIVFSRACSEPLLEYPRWTRARIEDACWQMLMSGALSCERIVQPVVPFADSAAAYERFVDREPALAIKLGVAFDGGGTR